ncbi:class I SAM-dependent methyltransferase [Chloroflexota bacterium]
MSEMYAALAKIYKDVGLGDESLVLFHRVFNHVQSDGWLGRRVLDLGCGIGESALWFGANGFRVTAIDRSPDMLEQARQLAQEGGISVEWLPADIRQMTTGSDYDLVIAMNVFNELRRTSDLEAALQRVNYALGMGKLFVFDVMTIQGFAKQWGDGDRVLVDADETMLTVRSSFNYETSTNTRSYLIFRQVDGQWSRAAETHILRGYVLQSLGTLLQRTGFKVQSVLNPFFEQFDPVTDQTGRAIFIVAKERDLS